MDEHKPATGQRQSQAAGRASAKATSPEDVLESHFAPPMPEALQAFDPVRNMARLSSLDTRQLSFLHESNAIEDINNIDYADLRNARPGQGHAGAFMESQQMGVQRYLLQLADICRWQRMLTEEQLRFGHDVPSQGVGRIRSVEVPFNVSVGNHVAPPFFEVPGLMDAWISDLHRHLRAKPPLGGDALGMGPVELIGDFFQRFEAIHPFVDGNGRTGRLIISYLATFFRVPVMIFRANERPTYYAAHKSKLAMRCFLADKIREAAFSLDGQVLERKQSFGATDRYGDDEKGVLVEWHALIQQQKKWQAEIELRSAKGSMQGS